jgi:hypothetical protein
MKQKLALYIDPSDATRVAPRPIGEWAENHPDSYVRVSEFVEVDFPDKPDAGEKHVETLRAKRDELRAEMEEKLEKMEELIRTVAALPAPTDV